MVAQDRIEQITSQASTPFAGSNTTGAVAESLGMRWIAVDRVADYLEASRFRFYS